MTVLMNQLWAHPIDFHYVQFVYEGYQHLQSLKILFLNLKTKKFLQTSWSTIPILPTPAAAKYKATGQPKPPAPTIRTKLFLKLFFT